MSVPPVISPESIPTSTDQQTAPSTNPEFDIVKQQIAQLTQVVGTLASTIQNRPTAAPPPPPITADDFHSNPQLLIDRIRDEISAQTAPLNQFRVQLERQQQYQAIKGQVKNANPQFGKFWHLIEPQLDQAFMTGNVEVHPQLVFYQAQAIFGGLVSQNPALLVSAPAPTPATMIPPSGSAPPNPAAEAPKQRELTDAERQVARRSGLTDAQYLNLLEGSAMIVTHRAGGTK